MHKTCPMRRRGGTEYDAGIETKRMSPTNAMRATEARLRAPRKNVRPSRTLAQPLPCGFPDGETTCLTIGIDGMKRLAATARGGRLIPSIVIFLQSHRRQRQWRLFPRIVGFEFQLGLGVAQELHLLGRAEHSVKLLIRVSICCRGDAISRAPCSRRGPGDSQDPRARHAAPGLRRATYLLSKLARLMHGRS